MKYNPRILMLLGFLSLSVCAQPNNDLPIDSKLSFEVNALNINSGDADFSPIYYKNGIVFCKNKKAILENGLFAIGSKTDLYYAENIGDNNEYAEAVKIKIKDKTAMDIGPATLSEDGKTLYFSKGRKREDKEVWGIYSADIDQNLQSNTPKQFAHNYQIFDVQHPTLAHDGQTLVFVSDIYINGVSEGGTDLYVSYKVGESWSRPQNLGRVLNTIENELYPYLHYDGTLYFASKGHNGFGGFDIFFTKQIDGKWMPPQNLGEPINSGYDDLGFAFHKDKERGGLLSSNRKNGQGSLDLYAFTATGFENEMELMTADLGEAKRPTQETVTSDLKPQKETNTTVKENVKYVTTNSQAKQLFINESIGMNKVYFPPKEWRAIPEAAKELDKLAVYMKNNPALNIKIIAHTDSRGETEQNKLLSIKRANTVKRYLVNKKIDDNRIETLGYGEKYVLNHCRDGMNCSDELHEENNRIEIMGLSDDKMISQWTMYEQPSFSKKTIINIENKENKQVDAYFEGLKDEELFYKPEAYQVNVGPFAKLDNRILNECKRLDTNLTFQDTPKGKMLVLGPYDTMQEANKNKAIIEERGVSKAIVTTIRKEKATASAVDTKKINKKSKITDEQPVDNPNYEIYVGPFKHIDNNTYHKFAKLNTEIHIEYTAKGMMIILGPYNSIQEAEQYKEAAKTQASRKTKIIMYNDEEALKNKKNFWQKIIKH